MQSTILALGQQGFKRVCFQCYLYLSLAVLWRVLFRYALLMMSPWTKPESRGHHVDPAVFSSPSMRWGYQVEGDIPVLEGPMPTSLPYVLPLYQCRSTCPQLATPRQWQPGSGPLPQPLQAIPLSPTPISRLPSWYLASWQLEVAPIGQPVVSQTHASISLLRVCKGPSLRGDELRVDGRWAEP